MSTPTGTTVSFIFKKLALAYFFSNHSRPVVYPLSFVHSFDQTPNHVPSNFP